jgi:hypothetical protein
MEGARWGRGERGSPAHSSHCRLARHASCRHGQAVAACGRSHCAKSESGLFQKHASFVIYPTFAHGCNEESSACGGATRARRSRRGAGARNPTNFRRALACAPCHAAPRARLNVKWRAARRASCRWGFVLVSPISPCCAALCGRVRARCFILACSLYIYAYIDCVRACVRACVCVCE